MENMNTNNLENIGENPNKFDIKRVSSFFVSNLIKNEDFILNEEFLDMISYYYDDAGKPFLKEVIRIIKDFLLEKGINKKTIKKIKNKYNGIWNDFFSDVSVMANVPLREIKNNLAEAIKTKVFHDFRDCFNLSSINLFNKRNNDIKSFFFPR